MSTTTSGVQPCAGQCCRNPWDVCYHARQCAHHRPEAARRQEIDAAAVAAEAAAAADRRAARPRSVLAEGRR